MNRFFSFALAMALSLSLAACNKQPTIDASTPLRLKETSEVIRAGRAGADLLRYDRAVTLIIASVLDPIDTINLASRGTMPTNAGVFERLKPAFDGLTYEGVVTKGEAAQASVAVKISQWKMKRAGLESRYRAYEGGAAIMQQVAATGVNLRTVDESLPGFGINQVMLDITITNGLDVPLEKAKFMVSLMPPNIANPWVSQPFTKAFPTPIPAGGSAQVEVGPIAVTIPEVYKGPISLETQIEFMRLEPKGQAPLMLPTWTQNEVVELAKLEAAIAEIENVVTPTVPAKI